MSSWKTMREWRESGPDNGTEMLLLFSDGTRAVGQFDGYSQHWCSNDRGHTFETPPVAWCEIPDVPAALTERSRMIADKRAELDLLEHAPLAESQ